MNKDEIKGSVKDIAGKAQQKVGELTGSETQQIKGLKNQAEGKIQKGVGHVKDALDDAKDE
ncbi:MAG: CsbD-like protein [Betaproteobacteria bacterium]|nr:CsbD-like protein [Betaproteobacteria bacterium]